METYKLNNETIDILSEKIEEVYSSVGSTKKETYRAKLLLEEALLKYQSRFGKEIEVYYRIVHIFSQTRFLVRLRSPSFDPFTLEENPMAFMIQSILSNFEGTMPSWKYRNLENEVVFTVKKKAKRSPLFKIGVFVAICTVLGIIARLLPWQDGVKVLVTNYMDPLTDAYAGVFCVMAVLLTFFAIALSIVHIGDLASVGSFGGTIMKRFYLLTLLLVVLLTLPTLPFFEISGLGTFSVAAKSIYDILISFVPVNIVAPFLNFNSVHIMIVGAMFGFSLLTMGQKGETMVKLFDECNLVAVITNNFLNRFIYIYVGFKLFSIITTSDFSQLVGAGKFVAFLLIAEALLMIFYTVYACIKSKMPLGKFIKVVLPSFMICLSSANFGAAFSSVYDSMFEAGVDGDTVNLSINLGSVVFQPGCALLLVFSSLFMACASGVEITVMFLVTAILLAVLLIASVPNIPGATIAVITLLFSQLGISDPSVLSLTIALSAILQFFTVAVDAWCLQSECICAYHSTHKKEEAAN